MNNDWYEKGELPPAGTECEYIIGEHKGRYNPCTFVGLNSFGDIVIEDCNGEYMTYHSHQIKFRPLCTETNKLIEQVAEVITDCFNQCNDIDDWCVTDGIAKAIVEAGYRKIKQMSEDEFMRASLSSFETKRFEVSQLKLICEWLRKIYSGGCRMIDNGVYNDE